MKTTQTPVVLACLLVMAACAPNAGQPAPVQEHIVLGDGQAVVIEVDAGSVSIAGASGEALEIGGQLNYPDRVVYEVNRSGPEIRISAKLRGRPLGGFSEPPVVLEVRVPQNVPIRVETFDAPVTLRDYRGDAEVASVSGDVLAENVAGKIALRSGRGNVTVRNGSGDLRVLGEHGVLTIDGVTGEVGSSTIMGTIRFMGRPGSGDTIRLETDHGPVEIQLADGSNLSVQVSSTSGSMSCILPGIAQDVRGCTGRLGNGEGALAVRTVSGDVTIQPVP